ncbi:MAG: DnaD domain-containing protein [Bacillota bacterium]
MGQMSWLRLYTEIIDDPKLRDCTGDQFRDWIYILCLARMAKEPGVIEMTPEDAAWRVRRPVEEFRSSLDLFASRDMLVLQDGQIVVTHFLARQYDKPSDTPAATRERQRRARERKQESRDCHADVTRCHALDTDPDPDRDTEVPVPPPNPPPSGEGGAAPAEELPPDPVEPVTKFLFESFLPTATAYQVDRLAAWVEQDGMDPGLVIWAMEQALVQGQRKLSYVEGILRRCKNHGILTRRAAEMAEAERLEAKSRDSPEAPVKVVTDREEYYAKLDREREELERIKAERLTAEGG